MVISLSKVHLWYPFIILRSSSSTMKSINSQAQRPFLSCCTIISIEPTMHGFCLYHTTNWLTTVCQNATFGASETNLEAFVKFFENHSERLTAKNFFVFNLTHLYQTPLFFKWDYNQVFKLDLELEILKCFVAHFSMRNVFKNSLLSEF